MIKILCAVLALMASVSVAEARKAKHVKHHRHLITQDLGFVPLFQPDWFSHNAGAPRTTANFPPARGNFVTRAVNSVAQMLPHPQGCPRKAFCGCGTAVEFFRSPVRSLWLAAAWLKFPRTSPGPGTAAVAPNRHHVVKVVEHVGGSNFAVIDHNSGRNRSRLHVRNLAGWTFVSPRG